MVVYLLAGTWVSAALAVAFLWTRRRPDGRELALAELADCVRVHGRAGPPDRPPGRACAYSLAEACTVLDRYLEEPAEAVVESEVGVLRGPLHWCGEHLLLQTAGAGLEPSGAVRVAFRHGGLRTSFFCTVLGIDHAGIRLATPRLMEHADARGPERRPVVVGSDSLVLRLHQEGASHSFPLVELSRTGASMVVSDGTRPPRAGTRLSGELVFRQRTLLRVRVEVRHLVCVPEGVRVGLSLRTSDPGDVGINDVLELLAA